MKTPALLRVLPAAIALTVAIPANAHAYVDPSTGSFVFQMVTAGVLGALFVVKSFWRQLKSAFGRLVGKPRRG